MKFTYAKQPIMVTLLVTLLVAVAISGSYMLYQQTHPDSASLDQTASALTPSTAWETYRTHEGGLSITYPVSWSVSEAANVGGTYSVFVDSPDKKTTLIMLDNEDITQPAIKDGIQLLASEPAAFLGHAYRWNYMKLNLADASGRIVGTTVEAALMTDDTLQATWPSSPDTPDGRGISVLIRNYDARTTAGELQRIPDVTTAKRIAESMRFH